MSSGGPGQASASIDDMLHLKVKVRRNGAASPIGTELNYLLEESNLNPGGGGGTLGQGGSKVPPESQLILASFGG